VSAYSGDGGESGGGRRPWWREKEEKIHCGSKNGGMKLIFSNF